MKKLGILTSFMLVLLLLCFFQLVGLAETEYIVLGTSSVGGSYYMYGGGISSYINNNVEGIIVTAETTRGSAENARLLGDRLEFALMNGNITWQSRAKDGRTNVNGVMTVDVASTHWVTLERTGIKSIEDLVGKRISIGAPGSGGEASAIAVLKAYGIWDEVEPNAQRLGFNESATALKDGHIVAFAGGSAIPMPAVAELASRGRVRLLDISDSALENLRKEHPPYIRWIIPAGTYDGVDYDVRTMGTPSVLAVDENVSDDMVYTIVKELFKPEAIKYMKNVYYAWEPSVNIEYFDQAEVPLHPGAERYFREAGLIK